MSTLDIRIAAADVVKAIGKELSAVTYGEAAAELVRAAADRLRLHAAALEAIAGVLPSISELRAELEEQDRVISAYRAEKAAE